MKLKELVAGVKIIKSVGNLDLEVKDVVCDSKDVTTGSTFICLVGENFDGHDYVRQVEHYGCVAVITQKEIKTNLTQIVVKDTRKAMSIIASNFYSHPEKELLLIGVTGTNGKTTTSHLIGSCINNNGISCGVIGTLGTYYNNTFINPTLTTPDPLVLYKIFREMVDNGVKVVVMEVSAHASFLSKLENLEFEVGIFTNFSQDHLDFFGNMESYKRAKIKFFTDNKIKYAVLNSDDQVALEIGKKVKKPIYYGLENPADVFAIDIEQKDNKTHFVLNLCDSVNFCNTNLLGKYNVYNALACVTACAVIGIPTKKIVEGLTNASQVKGRLEKVYSKDFSVIIDYAHTPDGLEKCLSAVKEGCSGKLICVFGCGGNRDSDKRSKMGLISGSIADFTVITSDNPRYEEPMEIIWQIEKGVLNVTKNYVIVQERKQAIEYAINMAKPNDVILVAGKGSENYQEVLGIKKPYNDKDTIDEIIRGLH